MPRSIAAYLAWTAALKLRCSDGRLSRRLDAGLSSMVALERGMASCSRLDGARDALRTLKGMPASSDMQSVRARRECAQRSL